MKHNRRCTLGGLAWAVLMVALDGCGPAATTVVSSWAAAPVTVLPQPVLAGEMSLEEALAQRRSIREFSAIPLTTAELGQLLWAAQGITGDRGFRTVPSAGALYPLELYAAMPEGVFHYEPHRHRLVAISSQDVRDGLKNAALGQQPVGHAPAVFILTAVYQRTDEKYGTERGPRYVHLEAGHAAQNLLLQAVALELGAVPIGAFDDKAVQDVLGLPAEHEPLYLIPVGHPAGDEG